MSWDTLAYHERFTAIQEKEIKTCKSCYVKDILMKIKYFRTVSELNAPPLVFAAATRRDGVSCKSLDISSISM